MSGNRITGEPRLASFASWLVLAASFGLSTSTWIALAVLAGFTGTATFGEVTLRLAWLMPAAVDGYVVVALVLWMSSVPAKVAAFAKKNTYGAAGIGIAAQSAYHALTIWSDTGIAWRAAFAAVIGALPPAVAGLAVHMRALIRRESSLTAGTGTVTAPAATTDHQPTRSTITAVPVAVPVTVPDRPTPIPSPSADSNRTVPATPPSPAPAMAADVPPTPADLAVRITRPSRPAAPTGSAAASGPTAPDHPHRSTRPTTPAPQLAPSATDTPVTAPDAAQLQLPLVDPALLERGRQVAEQYGTEHGTPITVGQLAVALRVPSDTAAQVLAAISGTSNPTTVNGHRPARATR
jgi:hypothetical protein